MAVNPLRDEEELCPNCGEFVAELHNETGWCIPCSASEGYAVPESSVCPRCGEPSLNGLATCGRCKYEIWIERNANQIEEVMAIQIVTAAVAKRIVKEKNRPICHSCHKPIKGGTKGRHFFCRTTPHCIRGSNVYERNLKSKPQQEALELAITASLIFKLTANISR